MIQPKTKTVFIDTQQFDAHQLSFSNPTFTRLLELVEAGHVRVLLTEVVAGEVRRHIRQGIKDARDKLAKFRVGGLFSNLKEASKPQLLEDGYWSAVENELLTEFKSLCSRLKVIEVPLSADQVNVVFAWYFSYDAPFDSQKRKAEFPDAFSIASVSEWAKINGETVFVVSGDGAFAVTSSPQEIVSLLTHVKTLDEFFELFPDPEITKSIKAGFKAYLDEEENFQFGEQAFQKLDFFVEDDENLEVSNVSVMYSQAHELHVVEADKGHAVITGEIFVTFVADVEQISETVEDALALVSAEIKVEYDESNPETVKVLDVAYAKKWAIEIRLPSKYRKMD